jgi:hypothetical protein
MSPSNKKHMKKIHYAIGFVFALLFFWACENELDGIYSGDQAVYFPYFTESSDSITYSFLGNPRDKDTIFLPLRLQGYVMDVPQRLQLRIVDAKSTAREGVHFEPLAAYYQFPANAFEYHLPIVLIKHPDLNHGPQVLALELAGTEELLVADLSRASVRIVFSNIAMKPDIWETILAPWFGDYSRIKHLVCMEIMGMPFPQSAVEFNLNRNMWRNWGMITSNHFRDNVVMNTDVDPPSRILPWF